MTRSWKNLLSLFLGFSPFLACSPLFAAAAQDYDQAGMALFRAGQYEKSIQYFNNAVQADATDWQGYEDMGDAYMKLDDKPNALSSYQKALQLNPGDSTLQALVDSLSDQVGTGTAAEDQTQPETSNPPAQPQDDSGYAAPAPTTIVVRHFRRHRMVRALPNYNDGLALMDHAPIWFRAEFGYDYSAQTQLMDSATATNTENTNGDLFFNFTSGNASMSHNGFQTGGELGFLLNPYNGIAIGARFIEASDYNLSAVNSNASTVSGAPSDFENATFSPRVVPITLDYYLFLPDHSGRFFVSGGVGYYFGSVQVNENYSLSNYYGNANAFGNPYGNLNAGNIGFQLGVGRDFAVTPFFGVSLYARGYFAQISNFQGTLSDGQSWALVKYPDNTVDIDNPSSIGSGGVKAATVDFTGFDIGASLNFFTF